MGNFFRETYNLYVKNAGFPWSVELLEGKSSLIHIQHHEPTLNSIKHRSRPLINAIPMFRKMGKSFQKQMACFRPKQNPWVCGLHGRSALKKTALETNPTYLKIASSQQVYI